MNPGQIALFSLESDAEFATAVARYLDLEPGAHEERDFGDGEHKIRPLESVRDRDVYVVQSLYGDPQCSVNDRLVKTLFFLGALRDAGAARLTAIFPYLGYARKDRRTKSRDPLSTRYLAQVVEAMDVDRVATIDVHNVSAFENSFRAHTETLSARNLFIDHFAATPDPERLCVASPDTGGIKRAESFREGLEQRLEREVTSAFLEKKRSEGEVSGQSRVTGDVRDRDVIVYDDLIASGTTMTRAAAAFLGAGARSVHAAATHGLFSGESDRILDTDDLAGIVITNTVPPFRLTSDAVRGKLEVLDASDFVGQVIERLNTGGSVQALLGIE